MACTARMGVEPHSVVDPGLKVRGLDGLWVADASILPEMICGNLQAICMAIGHKAADLITGRTRSGVQGATAK